MNEAVAVEFICRMCVQHKPLAECFDVRSCSHIFCESCMRRYITAKVEANVMPVGCPHPECEEGILEPDEYREILPAAVHQRWGSALCEQAVGARRFYCPHKDCSALLIDDAGEAEAIVEAECPHCHRLFCARCKVPWHVGFECEVFQQLAEEIRGAEEDPMLNAGCQEPLVAPTPPRTHGELRRSDDNATTSVDDPKETLLEEYRRSLTELEEEEASEFYCGICMEQKPLQESFFVGSCVHIFCASCMGLYIAAKVEENVTSIGCPDPACKDGVQLVPDACRGILPEGVYHRWGSALCEQAVGASGFYCPYKNCSALLIDDPGDGDAIADAECPHCGRLFCARCKVPWHDGIDCEGFQKLSEDERGTEDLMLRKLAVSSRWQRCPQCKIFVERIEGCLFIKCRCGHCFCYLCTSTMSADNHHCMVCNRTW